MGLMVLGWWFSNQNYSIIPWFYSESVLSAQFSTIGASPMGYGNTTSLCCQLLSPMELACSSGGSPFFLGSHHCTPFCYYHWDWGPGVCLSTLTICLGEYWDVQADSKGKETELYLPYQNPSCGNLNSFSILCSWLHIYWISPSLIEPAFLAQSLSQQLHLSALTELFFLLSSVTI